MPINNTTVVPILIAARLWQAYAENRVYAQRTNRAYEQALRGGPGDRIRINRANAATVADYTINQAITYTNADATTIGDLVIDKAKHFALKLDDIPALLSSSDLLSETVRLAGEDLAKVVDADVRTEFNSATGATAGLAITINHSVSGGFTADTFRFSALHRLLDVQAVPRAGRWIIMGPYSAEALQKYAMQNAVIAAPVNQPLVNGNIGNYAGFQIYVDNDDNSSYSSTNDTASETWFYGNDTAVAFAGQISRTEQLRLETTFADAVRGLYTYGVKTIDRTRLYKSVASISNIPD